MDLVEDAQAMQGELVELRRQIHREPEVGLMLPRTQQRVLSALDELPLSPGCRYGAELGRGGAARWAIHRTQRPAAG